jgi:hypothetical protein
MRDQGAYGHPRDAVECGFAEDWIRGHTGWWRCARRRADMYPRLCLELLLSAGEFGDAALYVGQGR